MKKTLGVFTFLLSILIAVSVIGAPVFAENEMGIYIWCREPDAMGESISETAPQGSSYVMPECPFWRDGYSFSGWIVKEFNEENYLDGYYNPGDTIKVDREYELLPAWERDPSKVSYSSIGQVNNLHAAGNGADCIDLSWDPVEGSDGYVILKLHHQYNDSNSYEAVKEPVRADFQEAARVEETHFKDTEVRKGFADVYYYIVYAVKNEDGEELRGQDSHVQPAQVEIAGTQSNEFPQVDFKAENKTVALPGYLYFDLSITDVDPGFAENVKDVEARDIIQYKEWEKFVYWYYHDKLKSGDNKGIKGELFLGEAFIDKGSEGTGREFDDSYMIKDDAVNMVILTFSPSKGKTLYVKYPLWTYEDSCYETTEEFDIGLIEASNSADLAEKIRSMPDGKTAKVIDRHTRKEKPVLSKACLDAIKNTNKKIVLRLDKTSGGIDWIFDGSKIKTTKDINYEIWLHIDTPEYLNIISSRNEIYWLEFFENGKLPEGTEIRILDHTLCEWFDEDPDYIKCIEELKNNDNLYVYSVNNNSNTITLDSNATYDNRWIYLNIDHNSSFGMSEQKMFNDFSQMKVSLNKKSFTYTGRNERPKVTVKNNGIALRSDNAYTVTYPKRSKDVGVYTITIKGKGDFKGKKTISYKIVPKGTVITKAAPGKKKVTIKWKKAAKQVTGYQIQYATNSSFSKGAKTVTISQKSKTSYTVKKLKANKKYYFRVRTYKKIGSEKLFSPWSTTMGTGPVR